MISNNVNSSSITIYSQTVDSHGSSHLINTKHRHTDTDTQIQTHIYRHTDTNTHIHTHRYIHTDTYTQIQTHIYYTLEKLTIPNFY